MRLIYIHLRISQLVQISKVKYLRMEASSAVGTAMTYFNGNGYEEMFTLIKPAK